MRKLLLMKNLCLLMVLALACSVLFDFPKVKDASSDSTVDSLDAHGGSVDATTKTIVQDPVTPTKLVTEIGRASCRERV